ncbi:hypothetical protein [Sphingobacterium sp.]|jgi:hypothetical protein|uniref:hypothetical protein n=1 Tax=Sphingobacterium sp. TaxID=341027 RepID=UPI00289E156E|nr:hypothetical protein [Sphingobacterium sp.]
MKKNFITITYNQDTDHCESKEFSSMQESAEYFKTFETSAQPNYVPVCIYNLNTETVLEVSDYYVNKDSELQQILEHCLAKR